MRIGDIMTRSVEVIQPTATLQDAATRMTNLNIGALPVCDGQRLLGMLTDRDIIIRGVAEGRDPNVVRVSEVMSRQVFYCYEDEQVTGATRTMEERQVRRLPVVSRDKELVGIVALGDIAINTGDENLTGQTLERVSEPAKAAVEIGGDGRSPGARARRGFALHTVAGMFDDQYEAQRALEDLRGAGIDPQRVSVITHDPSRARAIAADTGAQVAIGTATGAGLGLILGGAAGWLIGVGAISIPFASPIIAAGPLAAMMGVAGITAVGGAGAGAVVGGLVGALTAWGFSASEAHELETRVEHGGILVAAQIDEGLAPRAGAILRHDGADHVMTRKAA